AEHGGAVGAGVVRGYALRDGRPAGTGVGSIAHEGEGEASAGVAAGEGPGQVGVEVAPPSACAVAGVAKAIAIGAGDLRRVHVGAVEDEELVIASLGVEAAEEHAHLVAGDGAAVGLQPMIVVAVSGRGAAAIGEAVAAGRTRGEGHAVRPFAVAVATAAIGTHVYRVCATAGQAARIECRTARSNSGRRHQAGGPATGFTAGAYFVCVVAGTVVCPGHAYGINARSGRQPKRHLAGHGYASTHGDHAGNPVGRTAGQGEAAEGAVVAVRGQVIQCGQAGIIAVGHALVKLVVAHQAHFVAAVGGVHVAGQIGCTDRSVPDPYLIDLAGEVAARTVAPVSDHHGVVGVAYVERASRGADLHTVPV